jgi:hypothetical protein
MGYACTANTHIVLIYTQRVKFELRICFMGYMGGESRRRQEGHMPWKHHDRALLLNFVRKLLEALNKSL